MKIKRKIWKTGHIVIPAYYRKKYGLKPGDELKISIKKGLIKIILQ